MSVDATVALAAASFTGMGVLALAWPTRLMVLFGSSEPILSGGNEIAPLSRLPLAVELIAGSVPILANLRSP